MIRPNGEESHGGLGAGSGHRDISHPYLTTALYALIASSLFTC